jgi:ABC-type multidrug transport system permease subunit
MQRFFAILKARNIELLRDKTVWIWNVVFPVILIGVIALVFKNQDSALYKVGVVGSDNHNITSFKKTEHLQFIEYDSIDKALNKLKYHQIDLVLQATDKTKYWINDESSKGYLIEKILMGVQKGSDLVRGVISGRPIRYLDWVLPGILGINIASSALSGVGMVLVRYRKNGVLKRLGATPLSAFEFLTAQVVSRLFVLIIVTVLLFLSMHYIFDIVMRGSYGLLFFVSVLGTMTLISLGLLFASRTSSEEVAAGFLNLIILPMVFLSGVWYSLEGAPVFLQKIALLFPLTHMLNAAREIMTDGAGLRDISTEIIVLSVMMFSFLILASVRFKWGEDY